MSFSDPDDTPTNPTADRDFNDIVEAVRARRGFLKSGLAMGAVSFLGGSLAACGGSDDPAPAPAPAPAPVMLGFTAVAANTGDAITVPAGYRSAVFCRWGDPPIAGAPAWERDGT